jgi:hypothetical protein
MSTKPELAASNQRGGAVDAAFHSQPGPHFLGIGAQRSGSTWLHRNLQACSDIWLPPVKELHYFDELRNRPLFNQRFRKQRVNIATRYLRALRHLDTSTLMPRWDARFLLRVPNDRWYCSLFRAGTGRICGEITPAYSTLDKSSVEHIHGLLPNTKIIFVMRDPVERAWSQARKDLPRVFAKPMDQIAKEDVFAWFASPWCQLRTNYVRTLNIWRGAFGSEAMYLDFYESVKIEPDAMLSRILRFVGAKGSVTPESETTQKVVNRGREAAMPAEYQKHLAQLYLPMLEQLALDIGGVAEQWRSRNEAIASDRPPEPVSQTA